jgi:hypothetical protein
VSQEPNRTPDASGGSSDASAEHLLPGQEAQEERPIEVKRTPRLRSGKQEEPESSE